MADPNRSATIVVTYRDERIPPASRLSLDKGVYLAQLESHLGAMAGGGVDGTLTVTTDDGDAVAASGTLTLSSADGSVAGLVNGVSFASGAVGTDAAKATTIAAGINASANALVAGFVTAEAENGVITVTATTAGVAGNTITLAASGTGSTASGNRLTGGTAAGNSTTATITV